MLERCFDAIRSCDYQWLSYDKDRGNASLLDRAELIFSTVLVSGRKVFSRMQSADLLVLDETGALRGVDAFLPLSLCLRVVLMVGDQQQLGRIRSDEQLRHGFGTSILDRYADEHDKILVLTEQYRMHPRIAEFSSRHFYAGQLQTVEHDDQELLTALSAFVALKALVVFVDICGKDVAATSPGSRVNAAEMRTIELVLEIWFQRCGIPPESVGVIAAYGAQRAFIQQMINGREGFAGVKVWCDRQLSRRRKRFCDRIVGAHGRAGWVCAGLSPSLCCYDACTQMFSAHRPLYKSGFECSEHFDGASVVLR